MHYSSRIVPPIAEIPAWIDEWRYTRFVTLATNWSTRSETKLPHSKLPYGKLTDILKVWDARMNHAILGKHWAERHSDRIWAFYFLENPDSNPHWHGLVRFFPIPGCPEAEQERVFDLNASRIWRKLVPSGSVDVQPIYRQRGVIDYVNKQLKYPISYQHYVTPDEFGRRNFGVPGS